MFLDEARLAARIRHPNVVPTLDVVATGGELFLVMEYVPGESIARLSRALRERQQTFPLRILSAVMAGVLHGLQRGTRGEGRTRASALHRPSRHVPPERPRRHRRRRAHPRLRRREGGRPHADDARRADQGQALVHAARAAARRAREPPVGHLRRRRHALGARLGPASLRPATTRASSFTKVLQGNGRGAEQGADARARDEADHPATARSRASSRSDTVILRRALDGILPIASPPRARWRSTSSGSCRRRPGRTSRTGWSTSRTTSSTRAPRWSRRSRAAPRTARPSPASGHVQSVLSAAATISPGQGREPGVGPCRSGGAARRRRRSRRWLPRRTESRISTRTLALSRPPPRVSYASVQADPPVTQPSSISRRDREHVPSGRGSQPTRPASGR